MKLLSPPTKVTARGFFIEESLHGQYEEDFMRLYNASNDAWENMKSCIDEGYMRIEMKSYNRLMAELHRAKRTPLFNKKEG